MKVSLAAMLMCGAVGDGLGRPVEFLDSVDAKERVVDAVLADDEPLTVTDDTQLSVAIAYAFATSGVNAQAVAQGMAAYYRDPGSHQPIRSPGRAVMRAAEEISRHGSFLDPTADQLGSGALMRTPVFAFYGARELALETGNWSHNHPYSQACTAWIYDLCVHGRTQITGEMAEIMRSQQWGGFSAPGVIDDIAAAFAARTAAQTHRDVIRYSVIHGRDADTVGFIVGCALALIDGPDGSCEPLARRLEPYWGARISALAG